MPAADLMETASELLVQATQILGSEAPARRVVTVGRPVVACFEQLAVGVLGAREVRTADAPNAIATSAACASLTVVDLVVVLSACAPTIDESGRAPKPERVNASSQGLYGRAWTLWIGLRNRRNGDLLYPERIDERTVVVGDPVALAPEGGAAGFEIPVVVQLDPDPDLGMPA